MKRLSLVLVLALGACIAGAQSLQQYLALRKQYGIVSAARPDALNTFVGNRVFEVQGIVKGSFRVGERSALMLEATGGQSIVVDANAIPDWLLGNEVPARLLVKAYRESELSSLRAVLLAAAPEAQVAKAEADAEAKRKAAEAAAKKKKAPSPSAPPSGLYGPIGRGAKTSSRSAGQRQWVLPASEVTPLYAAFIRKQNPRLPASEALRIAQGIVGFSLHYGVDARLVMAMVMAESGFNPNAVSRAGAMGLGQLMPGTARWMNVSNPFDSIENLSGSVKLLRKHLQDYRARTGNDFDSLVLSLAAYNAGAGAVKRHGGVPPYRETQNYVRKVIDLYYRLAGHR